jgi:hypothetical protein
MLIDETAFLKNSTSMSLKRKCKTIRYNIMQRSFVRGSVLGTVLKSIKHVGLINT